MSINVDEQYNRLIQSLQLLASDCNQQILLFPDFVVVADEIALLYEENLIFLDMLLRCGHINEKQKSELQDIDKKLENMSHRNNLWTLDAIRNSLEWDETRRCSHDLLISLGIKYKKPDLYWIKFCQTSQSVLRKNPSDSQSQ